MKFITTYAVKTATKDNSKKSPSEEHTTHVRARRSSYPKSCHDQQRTFVAWQVTRHKYAQTKHFLKLRKFDVQAIKCLSHSNASVNSSCAQHPPPPPQATAGHLPALSVPGVGHLQIFALPGGRAFANPRAIPKLLICTRFPIRV